MLAEVAYQLADAWASARVRLSASWETTPHPPQRDTVSGPGHDPDRVLLAGGSSAVGWGVLDHELGLAGHLARQVAAITGRGVDVDVNASPVMSIPLLLSSLSAATLARYDAVVLTLGSREARQLMPARSWRTHLSALLDRIASASNAPSVVIIGAEESVSSRPSGAARRVTTRAAQLNETTRELVSQRSRVGYVDSGMRSSDPDVILGADRVSQYDQAARSVAPALAAALDLVPRGSVDALDELGRDELIEQLRHRSPEWDRELQRLVGTVRHLLDGDDAVLVLVGTETVEPIVADATGAGARPREGSLSDAAIHHRGGLVIPDLSVDPRFRDRPDVSGTRAFRAYAGHPVPVNGHSVAVLAIVDRRVRHFTPSELALLRGFCLRAGELLATAVDQVALRR